jgi:hypothetical protein
MGQNSEVGGPYREVRFTLKNGSDQPGPSGPKRARSGSRAHLTNFVGRSDAHAMRIKLMVRIGLSVTLLRYVLAELQASAKAATHRQNRLH